MQNQPCSSKLAAVAAGSPRYSLKSDSPRMPRTRSCPVSSGSTGVTPSSRTTAIPYSGAGRPIEPGRFGVYGSPTMPWLIVSVIPHHPIVLTPTCSSHGMSHTPVPNRRYECPGGTSPVATARADRPMSDSHVQPCWREMSQKRLVDHFGITTKRAPTHKLASIEYAKALVWKSGM